MIIEKCLKLFGLCFIIVPWTVCLQSNDNGDLWKFVQSTNFSDEYKKKLMNEMEGRPKWIKTVSENPNLEDQLKQCRSQIQSFKYNELLLKQNNEIITIQRVSIADKTSLLEIKKDETVKAHQQIDDYKDQLREKELEIKILQETISSYNNTINNNNAQISNLKSIIGSQNNTIFKNSAQISKLESIITNWKETVNKKDAEISRLKTTIESNNSTINKNNADISKLKSTVKNNNEIIAKLESTIKSYISIINRNNAEISNLKSEKSNTIIKNSADISKLESIITICKESVNKKDAEISRLKTTIKSNNSTINKKNADISKLELTITAFKTIVNKNNETIVNLELTINSFNSTIIKNNAEISKLKSEKINSTAATPQPRITCPSYYNKSQQEITQLKSEANKQTNEINELNIKLNKSLSNNKNLANSRNETFKKYQNAQISLESCQGNLESLKNESIKHIMTIQNLILKAENNQKFLDQCQENILDIQKVEQEKQLIQQQLNICQNDLKMQNADCSNKDSTIREWQKNQKAELERNSVKSELEKCNNELVKYIDDCSMKDLTIPDLRKKTEDNQKAEEEGNSLQVELNQCQINVNSTQEYLDTCKNSYDYFYKRSNALQMNLTDSQHELSKCNSLKDAIMRNFNSMKDELNECKPQSTTPSRSLPTSCRGLNAGFQKIQLSNGNPLYVLCDTDGWIIIQRRVNGQLDFNKSWTEYVDGFQDTQGELFIGLENLHLLTKSSRHELYISVTFSRDTYSVKYDDFRVGNAESFYELESIGNNTGNFFDGLRANVHHKFATYDKKDFNHDCGMGGWWYPANCGASNLNGPYNKILWYYGNGNSAIMKIRPYG